MKSEDKPEKPNCLLQDKADGGILEAYICDQTGTVWGFHDGVAYKYYHKWGSSFWEDFGRAPLKTQAEPQDKVNKPPHYGQGNIECIDYIRDFLTEEEYIGYLRGNVAKYLHRWRYKNGLEDLKKAQVYLGWMIETVEKES